MPAAARITPTIEPIVTKAMLCLDNVAPLDIRSCPLVAVAVAVDIDEDRAVDCKECVADEVVTLVGPGCALVPHKRGLVNGGSVYAAGFADVTCADADFVEIEEGMRLEFVGKKDVRKWPVVFSHGRSVSGQQLSIRRSLTCTKSCHTGGRAKRKDYASGCKVNNLCLMM